MAIVVQSFEEGAYILTADGEQIPVYEGMEILPDDQIIGQVVTIEANTDFENAELGEIQKAILAGADPTQIVEPTAAGAPQAGQPQDGGGSSFVALDRTKGEVDPEAGYPTGTFPNVILEPEDEVQFNETIEIVLDSPTSDDNPVGDVPVIPPIEPILDDEIPEEESVDDPVSDDPTNDDDSGIPPREPETETDNDGTEDEEPVDDNSDEEDGEEESPETEDEEDETEPETDGPESEDDESDEDESEGEGDQTDEDQEGDDETEDQDDSEDDESEDDTLNEDDVFSDDDETIDDLLEKVHQDNGFGNGDDDSPGNSGDNNNAENRDGGTTDGMDYAPGNSGNTPAALDDLLGNGNKPIDVDL